MTSQHEPVTLSNCEREPIHRPGCIQPHGALLACSAADGRITHASANLQALIGLDPAAVLGQTLDDVLGAAAATAIRNAVDSECYSPANILTFDLPHASAARCYGLVHQVGPCIVAEFEPAPAPHDDGPVLSRVQAIAQALRRAATSQQVCDVAVEELRHLTGYDRVMVYRFDRDGHGTIVAERCAPAQAPFLHLRYPASDIPAQARRLYLVQRVRTIVDIGYTPVPLLTQGPDELDMSYCALRSVSPMHVEYLRNMGVRATFAVSLICDNALWGMLVFHHDTPRQPLPELRALCDLIGQIMSLLIDSKDKAEAAVGRLARQDTLEALRTCMLDGTSVSAALAAEPERLLALVEASGAVVRLGGQVHEAGDVPPAADSLRIMSLLRAAGGEDGMAVDSLGTAFPGFAAEGGGRLATQASGVLFLPILHNPGDGIAWFRPEVTREVRWGGDPDKAMQRDPATGNLGPRTSFAIWRSLLHGHAAPWTATDRDMAHELRRAVMTALLRHTEAQLAHLSHHDALTNLPNRRHLQDQLDRCDRGKAALIFLDLDRFKTVNDSLGHGVGDDLLIQVAQRLTEVVPPGLCTARLGGDEFVVLCEHTAGPAAEAIAGRILAAFQTPFMLNGRPFHAAVSVGIAQAGTIGGDDLLRAGDAAMYAAKRRGGNQAVTFETHLHEAVLRRMDLEQDLFKALDRNEMDVAYQPLERLPDGGILGFEALLRWRHPCHGNVSPAEFIPLAEETDLIVPLGTWILQQALLQVAQWRAVQPRLRMSVNVSGQQLLRGGFVAVVQDALAQAGLAADALMLEVTESILMRDTAVAQLRELQDLGVCIAVDDFGTGYSSLAYLDRLPVAVIKVDRSFLAHAAHDIRKAALFDVIVQLGRILDLHVIAEGVETEEQWLRLQESAGRAGGCAAAQGYWLGRPGTAEDARVRLAAAAVGPHRVRPEASLGTAAGSVRRPVRSSAHAPG